MSQVGTTAMKCLACALALLTSTAVISGSALADPPPEPAAASPSDEPADPTAVQRADAPARPPDDAGLPPAAFRSTSISLTGAMSCELSSRGGATTTWRHGRQKSGRSIHESVHRVTVSGAGACGDRSVELSASFFVPALRPGAYTLQPGAVVTVWARSDRTVSKPDMAWDASERGAGPASLVVTIDSIRETTGKRQWRDGVAVEVRNFDIEGTIQATVPCAQDIPKLRRSCRAETVTGTF